MISKQLGRPVPQEVADACDRFQQGHLIESPALFYWAQLDYPLWNLSHLVEKADDGETESLVELHSDDRPPYGLITTQTCDLIRPDQEPWFQVAPVFETDEPDDLFDLEPVVPLDPPALPRTAGKRWFVDLRLEMPLEKGVLVGRTPIQAYPDELGYLRLADHLARRKGRPALHSVFNRLLNGVMREMKRDSKPAGKKFRKKVRPRVYKLKLAIEDGTRLRPAAAKLYIVADGSKGSDENAPVVEWFDEWWNIAREEAEQFGLELLPVGWLDANSVDARLYDDLIDVSSREPHPPTAE